MTSKIIKNLKRSVGINDFSEKWETCRNRKKHPEWDDAKSWEKSINGTTIRGWRYSNRSSLQGTIFLCHGFSQNCMSKSITKPAELFKKWGYSLMAVDFRFHGFSSYKIMRDYPTLGENEMWDIRAMLDKAYRLELPKPWILYSYSMGAMACSRFLQKWDDVEGVFLLAPPYKPIHGIKTQAGKEYYRLLKSVNYIDKLNQGDIRRHRKTPKNKNVLICYLMGNRDKYGHQKTRDKSYSHWFDGHLGKVEEFPDPNDRITQKWWVSADGENHQFNKTEEWSFKRSPNPYKMESLLNLDFSVAKK
jgi:pimeloyl-ACP methyl ester carboxylesterase